MRAQQGMLDFYHEGIAFHITQIRILNKPVATNVLRGF